MKLLSSCPTDQHGVPIAKIVIGGKETIVTRKLWDDITNADENDDQWSFVHYINSKSFDFVADCLLKKNWYILKSENDGFITSDDPVCMWNKDNFSSRNPGIRKAKTIILFPLTPRFLIKIDEVSKGDRYQLITRDQTIKVNAMIWITTPRFMISPRHPDIVHEEIGNAMLDSGFIQPS
jgi:hypothetical protein